ncbi:MAG: crossover junction endodeoxyribonuclease RuvC [Endozoicomonadaceae bacterium]|nr:crossover junction endodeoxyribonuclease RuvC [Endozoicomonadaceae bacterium]
MTIILGIDPGSVITGFGVIQISHRKPYYIASGCIQPKTICFFKRLEDIHSNLTQLIAEYQPNEISIEKVFMSKNPDSALKLGHARGVAILAAIQQFIPIYEYAARAIKQAVVGKGSAEKKQVQHMVTALLSLNQTPKTDASDALAAALCHHYHQSTANYIKKSQSHPIKSLKKTTS